MGCRRVRDATQLVRVARRNDGELVAGSSPGRGAWLCGDRLFECLDAAGRRGAFGRALHARVLMSDVEKLRARLEASVSGLELVTRSRDVTDENERER